MKSSAIALLSLSLATACSPAAFAISNPLDPTEGFSVFVKGNASFLSGDTHGTVAVGGDVTVGTFDFANNSIGSYVASGDAIPTALVVGGQLNIQGNAKSKGFVKIGDTTGVFLNDSDNGNPAKLRVSVSSSYGSGPFLEVLDNNQSAASAAAPSGIDFDAAFLELNHFSGVMTGLSATHSFLGLDGANGNVDGKIVFDFSANAGLSVLNLTASEFGSIGEFNLLGNAGSGDSLIVNVDLDGAAAFNFNSKFAGNVNPNASSILWNFTNGVGLNIHGDSFIGTIFAPSINLDKVASNNIEGAIVANSYTHRSGEVHLNGFDGGVPDVPVPDASSTFWLALAGLPILLVARRRR